MSPMSSGLVALSARVLCCSEGLTLLFPGKLHWGGGREVVFLAFLLGLEMILLTRGKESINEGPVQLLGGG